MLKNIHSSRNTELNSLKNELENYRKFMKLDEEKMINALSPYDEEEYNLWNDDYSFNAEQVNVITERIRELEGAI